MSSCDGFCGVCDFYRYKTFGLDTAEVLRLNLTIPSTLGWVLMTGDFEIWFYRDELKISRRDGKVVVKPS